SWPLVTTAILVSAPYRRAYARAVDGLRKTRRSADRTIPRSRRTRSRRCSHGRGSATGLPAHGSRNSATHGTPVNRLIAPAMRWAVTGDEGEYTASGRRDLTARTPVRTANGSHPTWLSGKNTRRRIRPRVDGAFAMAAARPVSIAGSVAAGVTDAPSDSSTGDGRRRVPILRTRSTAGARVA